MSIKDRLAKKTEGLLMPNKDDAGAGTQTRLRTSPGQMLMVNSLMKESNEKVALLEARLKEFEGALAVRLIDPQSIVPSKWANRIDDSFDSAEFAQLREEIAQSEGNVQPIKVRPLKGDADRYEIVFGHRRHRACLELGLPVLAFVEEVSDQDLFKEMDRENRKREDLSPWEQGRMYRRALDEELFASLGELSKELGVDKGNLSKALKLADLPDDIVNAFPSPLELQYRWAKLLNDALQSDPEGVLARAKEINEDQGTKRSSKEVLDSLLGVDVRTPTIQAIVVDGKPVAKVVIDDGRVSVQFAKGVLGGEKTKQLYALVRDFMHK
ncbi:MAG: ParB family transcriptional regulator, chromosome partitioning protein [Burkholderiales bacterium]|jgi:ParB family chromosome partitioning protein